VRSERQVKIFVLMVAAGALAGCPKSQNDLKLARQAEDLQDFDAAVNYYERAQKSHPTDSHIKIRLASARFAAATAHIAEGRRMGAQGNLEAAAIEFRQALSLDPADGTAGQELRAALEAISAQNRSRGEANYAPAATGQKAYAEQPAELKPLSRSPISLKMVNDTRIMFETIGKQAGLTVIFDPDLPARRIAVELDNVSLRQALDIVALESKTFWKPLAENVILVLPDQQQKRKDYDDLVIQTFYLSNAVQSQDLTEVVNGLRQLLDLRKVQQINSMNAIVIRDTPAKLAIAQKFIADMDRAKPEVLVQVAVLQARSDVVRKLGISPGTSASLAFCGSSSSNCSSSSSSSGKDALSLQQLGHLSSADYSVTLPGASVAALLTNDSTKIIQDPEIRSVDGQAAKLKIGDRVPVATGSYSSGSTTSTSALVQTQYQYIDVGVNVDVTPRIHLNREISLKVAVEVSSVTGYSTIGSLQEPIISQRRIEHDVRLKEGEVSILGGLFERTETKSISGWPGLAGVPFLNYLFSQKNRETVDNEVLIVLTPRIVRLPDVQATSLPPLYTGSETNVQIRPAEGIEPIAAAPAKTNSEEKAGPSGGQDKASGAAAPRLRFEPAEKSIQAGETLVVQLLADNARDLSTLPVTLEFNPQVLTVVEVRQGNLLSEGGEPIAVVQRNEQEEGRSFIRASRPPNVPGVTGSGPVLEIVVRGVAPGRSRLSIGAVHATTSRRAGIAFLAESASIEVSR
jgi:general secretion pathway protein D